MNPFQSCVNQKRMVFDNVEWNKTGDVGDNSQFWKECVVLNDYVLDGERLLRVKFPDGRISYGHFYSATKELAPRLSEVKPR
jgi:hypothetical protein